jgi:MoaA/NifB/PqqE/SkfB family radical SAM enzyme
MGHKDIRLLLTREQRRQWPFPDGTSYVVNETSEGLLIRPSEPLLTKIYLEPTSNCNLHCRTCVRNSWQESGGTMTMRTFVEFLTHIKKIKSLNTISLWGFGEPLMHPDIIKMIRSIKKLGLQAEIITNGTLLSSDMSKELVRSKLDRLILSIDGTSPESHSLIRPESDLQDLIHKVSFLNAYKKMRNNKSPEIGMEFVLSKRNIEELPELPRIARLLCADFIIISNIIPYTEDFKNDILYGLSVSKINPRSMRSNWCPEVILPRIDKRPEYVESVANLVLKTESAGIPSSPNTSAEGYCPFIWKGALAVRWDGEVSPCIPLMHSYTCYVLGREKTIRRYSIGNINNESIKDIWQKNEFKDFRKRVRKFDFSPCIHCDCMMAESNEEDCFGSPFPTCGDCLWAHHVVICP